MVMTAPLHFKQNDLAGKLNMKYALSAYARSRDKPVIGIPTLTLDNWISNGNIYIKNDLKKNLSNSLSLKKSTFYQKNK
jgi:hypothetical protein